jgi:hypothetical protein
MTHNCGSCTTPRSPIRSLISIAVSADGTQILYDHHEDGYERDPSNPTGLKPGGTTEIWGDGDPSNGVAPRLPADLLAAGDVISLDNDVDVPSGAHLLRRQRQGRRELPGGGHPGGHPDRTRFAAGGRHRGLPDRSLGHLLCRARGRLNTRDSSSMFQYSALYVMAQTDNTVCDFDPDPSLSSDNYTRTLDQGETVVVKNVHDGGTVDCDKNVHVDLITGDIGVNYETRWFALTATSRLSNDYFGPVGNPRDNGARPTSTSTTPPAAA